MHAVSVGRGSVFFPSFITNYWKMSPSLTRSASRTSLRETQGSRPNRFPRILQVLRCTGGKLLPNLSVTLPSNINFRMTNYFKLLAAQKKRKEDEALKLKDELEPISKPETLEWLTDVPQEPEAKRPRRGKMSAVNEGEILWKAQDIVKAANLLLPNNQGIFFEDEEEMRRVFTLLYDVFRYKTILKEALDETGFSEGHSQFKDILPLVWLFFYDLYKRRFLPREHEDEHICKSAFTQMGLDSIEDELWKCRVRLAAALARNRIKHNALRLNHLLPKHLRDERLLSVDLAPATAWINTSLTSKSKIVECLSELGISVQNTDNLAVNSSSAKFDHVCPKVISMPASTRPCLARSNMVKKGHLIMQDRAFCVGPTCIYKILQELSLRGTVAQSHVISPRATAYLANLLLDNEKIEKVMAFGTGNRTVEYQEYLKSLGVENCELHKERWCDVAPDAEMLENVVAVLATPPTSWTGVADPVDLVCSRSGDMDMLRALTQTRRGRDALLLEEQRDTLRFSMSLPQVQVVLYESHSMSSEENSGMVQSAVKCMNEWARQKHAEEQRLLQEQEEAEEKLNKALLPGGTPAQREKREREALEAQEALATPMDVLVPPCDLFEVIPVPNMCPHGIDCIEEEGCYTARIQRKEIIGLDAKYMIKIAEARGLFGTEPGQKKSSTARSQRKKEEHRAHSGSDKNRSRRVKIEMDRISAHTHASMNRYMSSANLPCERFNSHARDSRRRRDDLRRALIRSWWHETFHFLRLLIPYWRLTPRTRAVRIMPVLRLPRVFPRRPFPIHTVILPVDAKSEPGDLHNPGCSKEDFRRNSC